MRLVNEMAPIATFVFLDLETTGLPKEELNKTKITELSLIAVKRSHILETKVGLPRVQQKLTLCLNPRRTVHPTSTEATGLCNFLLEHEPTFDLVFNTINNFLSLLSKPVCLIAHNGMTFDYPILKRHLVDINVSFPDDLLCADSLHCFYDIETKLANNDSNVGENMMTSLDNPSFEEETLDINTETKLADNDSNVGENMMTSLDNPSFEENIGDMQKHNELTPKKSNPTRTNNINCPKKQKRPGPKRITNVRRNIFYDGHAKPQKSYKLENIYERYLRRRAINAHNSEYDCTMALECSVAKGEDFVQWVDNNHCHFAEVLPMTIGVRLGY